MFLFSLCQLLGQLLSYRAFNTDVKVCSYHFLRSITDQQALGCEVKNELMSDYVINISALKDGDYNYLKREAVVIREVAEGVVKAIIETSYSMLRQNISTLR